MLGVSSETISAVVGIAVGWGVKFVIGVMRGTKKRLEQEQTNADRIAAQVEQYKEELKGEIDRLLALRTQQVTDLRAELQATREELRSTRDELRGARSEVGRLQSQLDEARKELGEVRRGQAACSLLNTDQCPGTHPKVQT